MEVVVEVWDGEKWLCGRGSVGEPQNVDEAWQNNKGSSEVAEAAFFRLGAHWNMLCVTGRVEAEGSPRVGNLGETKRLTGTTGFAE